MKKKDIILTVCLLIVAAVIYLIIRITGHSEGNQAVVTVAGKEYGVYRLDENKEFKVKSENGYNIIVISDGKVYIKDADCPDKYCVHQGKISKSGETLICLPHKLSVEVKKDDDSGANIDAIAK